RAAQIIRTVKRRVAVVCWMLTAEEKDGVKGLFAQAVDTFSEIFRACSRNTNLADSFVFAKIKDAWRRKWNERQIALTEGEEWQNANRKDGSWSGKLKNPGKKFFLSLAADCVREVNSQRDKHGLNYERKAMVRYGLSLGLDGIWSPTQLYPHLQEIIRKYPADFASKTNNGDCDDSSSET
ncbi:hypothetical protein PHMEG_00015218, partial [Phytophthora megakarya]